MTYQTFEDLPVWQKAVELYELIEELLENQSFAATRAFKDQVDRAALSVSNNIAEGFERGTTNELLSFIYIARGSAGEVRSMLCVKERRAKKTNWPADLKFQISNPSPYLVPNSCGPGRTICKTRTSKANAI